MTLTPRAKRVIDLAYDEARDLNNRFIGTEHLLLGLAREADGLAGKVLQKVGAGLEPLRRAVRDLQDGGTASALSAPQKRVQLFQEPYLLGARICEHIVLSVIAAEETVSGRAVRSIVEDVSLLQGQIWDLIRNLNKRGIGPIDPAELADLLREAHDEAKAMESEGVEGHHLLLAACRLQDRPLAHVLGANGLEYEKLRDEIEKLLAGEPSEGPDPSP